MSENKTLGITISGDIEDILTKLEEVIGKIGDIPDRTIDLGINAPTEEIETLKSNLDDIDNKTVEPNISTAGLDNLSEAADEAVTGIESIGDASANVSQDITGNLGGSSSASESVVGIGTSASEASSEVSSIGQAGEDAAVGIEDSGSDIILTIEAIAGAAEIAAEKIYGLSQESYELATYTGMSDDEIKKMETDLSSASFQLSDIDDYLTTLMQLGVSNNDLEENAAALNEIVLGTGSAASEGTAFAKAIKVLGGDVSNLTDYYGLAAYAQKNVVGGLSAFDSIAKTLGPKLTDMGLSADESAVVIAALSQKYGGNIRMMRKAITDADGDSNKLYETLGLTSDQVDTTTDSFSSYVPKLKETAEASKKSHTPLQQAYADLQDIGLMAGFSAADLLGWGAVVLGIVGAPYVLAKAIDVLSGSTKYASWYANLLKSAVRRLGDVFKDIGSKILETIRSWMGWGDEAGKAAENVGQKMLEKGPTISEAAEEAGESAGKGFSEGMTAGAELIDEAGNVVWKDTEGVIGRVADSAPAAEEAGAAVSEGIGSGILRGASRLLGDVAVPLIIIQSLVDAVYNIGDNLEKSPLEIMFDVTFPFIDLLPQQIQDAIHNVLSMGGKASYKGMLSAFFGENAATDIVSWVTDNIQNPFRNAIDWALNPANVSTSIESLGDMPGQIYDALSGVPGSISSALENAPAAFDNFTNRLSFGVGWAIGTLYKFPGRAYTAITGWGQSMYNALLGLPAWLQGAWGNTVTWFTVLPSQLRGYGTRASNGMISGFKGMASWFTNLPSNMYNWGVNAWNGLTSGFNTGLGGVYGAINGLTSAVHSGIDWIMNLPGNMYNWGKSIIDSFVQGLSDSLSGAKSWIEEKLGWLFEGFKSASPPKTGPLQNIDKWAISIGSTFAEGVSSGLSASKDLLSTTLGSTVGLTSSTPLPSASVLSQTNNTGGVVIQFTGDIKVPEGSDAVEVGRDLGRGAAEGWAERVKRQAGNNGISVENMIR